MSNALRYLIAAVLLLLALGVCFWPEAKDTEVSMVPPSSAPHRENLAPEFETPPHTEPQRASRGVTIPHRRPAPAPRARTAPSPAPVASGDVFDRLAACESGMRQNAVGGGGRYLSFFQWTLSTWHAAGGQGDPRNVDYGTQKAIAMRWAQRSNPYGQWPTCWPRVVGR